MKHLGSQIFGEPIVRYNPTKNLGIMSLKLLYEFYEAVTPSWPSKS